MSRAELKERCEGLYRRLLDSVLVPLISSEWVVGEAEEEGLRVSDRHLRALLEHARSASHPSQAAFRRFLEGIKETVSGWMFETRVHLLEEALRERVVRGVGAVSAARVAQYFRKHRSDYELSEERNIDILRAKSRARAMRAKQELESGVSFGQVVKRLGEAPVYDANAEGLIVGLKPTTFEEPVLSHAIFGARPHVVGGPVKLDLFSEGHAADPLLALSIDGYYVFVVEKVTPPHFTPFSQMRAVLTQELPEMRKDAALAKFIAPWRAKWTARTDCAPGYVVRKCRQFKSLGRELAENPYALD